MKVTHLKFLFLMIAVFVCGTISAQTRVKGTVVDEEGLPIVGATVMATPSKVGTITDLDGKFDLSTKSGDKSLSVSFIGYATEVVKIAPTVKVVLKSDATEMDEVIVVAYGSAKKSSFTGSASVVKADKLEKFSGTGFTDALQGMTAGVNVTADANNPGAEARIAIRGVTNMAGNTTPLYVVDGVPYDGSLNSINPNDIETLTVLKDAAAASLYGSRAANGVVIITTKTGKSGKTNVSFNATWGTSDNAVGYLDKADPKQTLLLTWEGLYNDKFYFDGASQQEAINYASSQLLGTVFSKKVTNSQGQQIFISPFKHIEEDWVMVDGNGKPYINPNLQYVWNEEDWDWYGAYYDRKLRQNYSVDISGASKDGKTNYFTSIGLLDDKGYGGNDYYKRYSFNANVNSEINKWLSMGGGVRYAYYRQNTGGNTRALNYNNTLSSPYLRNKDNTDWMRSELTGDKVLQYGAYTNGFFGVHPMASLGDYWDNPNNESFSNTDGTNVNARFYAELKLPFNVKFKSTINLDDNTSRGYSYGSAVWGSNQQEPYGITIHDGGGNATRSTYQMKSITNSNMLTWDYQFGKHNVNLLAGMEAYSYRTEYTYGYGEGIYQLGQFQVASAADYLYATSQSDEYALLSWIGKADYNYDNKYYLSGSFRRDGSSRFSPENRWGNFWSVGGSWRISKEAFMEDVEWVNNLTLRSSYGTTGNDRLIPRQSNGKGGAEALYAYQGTYASDNLWAQAGLKPNTIATPELKWEQNEQWNIGVDFNLFDIFSGTMEYYVRKSNGLLYYYELPLSAHVGNVAGKNTNLGDIKNSGFEFTLGAQIFNTKDFQWRVDANISTLKNEVTYLPNKVGYWSNVVANYKLEEGGSLYDFWGPRFAGINAETGYPEYYKADGTKVNSTSQLDQNKDWVKFGSALPSAYGSITNTLAYKGFDFSMMWYYSLGGKMYCYNRSELGAHIRKGVSPAWDLVKNRWTGPGDKHAETPMVAVNNRGTVTVGYSDYYVLDNDYLRLRNLTFGYTLPNNLTKKLNIQKLRVYVSGDNLLTFAEAKKYGTDPETGISGNTYNGNSDSEGYSGGRRIYTVGLNLTF